MQYMRFSALALSGALTLSLLTACGGGPAATPTPEVGESQTVVTVEPSPSPAASETPNVTVVPADPTPEVTETAAVIPAEPTPEATAAVVPLATPVPTAAPAVTPEPTAEPAAEITAAEVYAKVSAAAGGNAMSDVSFVVEEYYNLSVSDLEDYVLYMPDMSTQKQEIFLAKVKSGKVDGVKTACESRLQGLREETDFYAGTGDYVDGYQLVTNGDWLLFCVCENPSGAVSAFNDCTK